MSDLRRHLDDQKFKAWVYGLCKQRKYNLYTLNPKSYTQNLTKLCTPVELLGFGLVFSRDEYLEFRV